MALPELDTRSVLNTVEENFERLGLKAYAERMIYAGEHIISKEELINHFQSSIQDVNAGYCDINVRGLLLVYNYYFVHIVEILCCVHSQESQGSEDTIHRHLRFLFSREAKWIQQIKDDEAKAAQDELDGLPAMLEEERPKHEPKIFGRLKLLMVYHSIQTLLFKDWHAVTAHPPSLITKLDTSGSLVDHIEQLRICLDKIQRLCKITQNIDKVTFEALRAKDPKMDSLPETNLLEFLLQSQHILDLRDVLHLHRRVDDYTFYFEMVWPLPTQFTPKQLYKLKVDDSFVEPLPVMPWEISSDVAEEEEKEQSEGSSD